MAPKRIILILLLGGFIPVQAAWGVPKAKIEALAHSKAWLRLLHYYPSFPFRTMKSRLDGPEFFFAKNGKSDPHAELTASIQAFSENRQVGKYKQHPQCAFPARYRFLKSQLKLSIKDVPCKRLDEYMRKFNAQSTSLIFSSAYPNNPSSMFGHTFLKINSKKRREDILDYGISYAATVPPEENSFAFVYFGLFGGYIGQFSMIPYYVKVKEYNYTESRDLWEYELNLTENETKQLLFHLWEIETNSWFDYYFFDENCSFILLAVLEAVKPEWDLTDFTIHVIPAETVKRLSQTPNAIGKVTFRPALRRQMLKKYYALNSPEKNQFLDLIDNQIQPMSIKEPNVLETTAIYLRYEKEKNGGKLSADRKILLRDTLIARSKLGLRKNESSLSDYSSESRPDWGHHPYRLGISGGFRKTSQTNSLAYFQELHFKLAYHDLMDNDVGYIPFSHIDFPGLTLRYTPLNQQLSVENLHFVSITSLFPFSLIEKRISWKMNFDYYSVKDFGCLSCHLLRAEGGIGITLNTFSSRAVIYSFILMDLELGSSLDRFYRILPKLESAWIWNPWNPYKLRLGGTIHADILQNDRQLFFYKFLFEQSFNFSPMLGFRLGWEGILSGATNAFQYQDAKLTVFYYF